jgi:predicted ester cyclase
MSTERNKTIIRSFIDIWNSRDFNRFDEILAEDCCLSVSGEWTSCSPEATRAIATRWCVAFPDWHFALDDLIAEGDRVVARMTYTGTQLGSIAFDRRPLALD